MKKNFKFLSMAVLASLMIGGVNTACTSDEANGLTAEVATVELVKAPDFRAWSGDVVYGDTRTTRAWYDDVEDQNKRKVMYADSLHNDEVEVNLSINAEHKNAKGEVIGDWTSSHLSVHVRKAVDFTVTLPVKAEYYCQADDMEIVKTHKENLLIHGGKEAVTYNIGGQEVTLNLSFGDEGITIWSEHVHEVDFDALYEETGDGVTFEVWNYYNDEDEPNAALVSRSELRGYLNDSKICFSWGAPTFYINAFGELKTYNEDGSVKTTAKNEWDCTVQPITDDLETYNYKEGVEDVPHYGNGSQYNVVYVLDGVELADPKPATNGGAEEK